MLLSDARAAPTIRFFCWRRLGALSPVGFATLLPPSSPRRRSLGAFSLTQQSIQSGFLPRMRVLHTASHEKGQIYIPLVNWLLALGTLGAVFEFGSSDALGGAYGIAVSMRWRLPRYLRHLLPCNGAIIRSQLPA